MTARMTVRLQTMVPPATDAALAAIAAAARVKKSTVVRYHLPVTVPEGGDLAELVQEVRAFEERELEREVEATQLETGP